MDSSVGRGDASGGSDGGALDASESDSDSAADADAHETPPVPDPCPMGTIGVNCDPTCDAGSAGYDMCSQTTCGGNFTGDDDPNILNFTAPAILRTPSMPMQDSDCTQACNPALADIEPMVFGMVFRINPPSNNSDALEVRVGSPWWIDEINGQGPTCAYNPPEGSRSQGCSSIFSGDGSPWVVLVWTSETDAVARDIQINEVPASAACE